MKELLKKRINKKGFTLIELLAVIVILAVLMLLALPAVLRIMENARRNAFETEVRAYLKAAQTKYAELSIDSTNSGEMCFTNNEGCLGTDGNGTVDVDDKTGYNYTITVSKDSTTNSLKYTYSITNGTYQAGSGSTAVDYNSTISVGNAPASSTSS